MGMQLSGDAVELLSLLGFNWPNSDETGLIGLSTSWDAFSSKLIGPLTDADDSAGHVWSTNEGDAVTAFREAWNDPEAASQNLSNAAVASTMVGVGLTVCAGIVVALKVNIVIQLVALSIQIAEAIAMAALTGGVSLLAIPAFRAATKVILDQLRSLTIDALLGA